MPLSKIEFWKAQYLVGAFLLIVSYTILPSFNCCTILFNMIRVMLIMVSKSLAWAARVALTADITSRRYLTTPTNLKIVTPPSFMSPGFHYIVDMFILEWGAKTDTLATLDLSL